MRKKFKFKQLLNTYRSLEKELSNIREVMKDLHFEFEDFYKFYCNKYSIDINSLNQKNSEKISKAFKEQAVVPRVREKLASKERDHKDLYKDIARKIHPDKISSDDPNYNQIAPYISLGISYGGCGTDLRWTTEEHNYWKGLSM